jgi:hypothetical protein
MKVNGREVGNAFTYASQNFTNKFWNLDRIMFSWSPYLTDDESWKIMDEMEKRAKSQYEGNWTTGDCMMFLRETLGNDRVNAIERMWEIENQNAVLSVFSPDELKETWVDKVSLCEVTPDQVKANPENYVLIKLPKTQQELGL